MSENTISFKQIFNNSTVEITLPNGLTWMELSEEYLRFLNACGYAVTAQDLTDYFGELAGY